MNEPSTRNPTLGLGRFVRRVLLFVLPLALGAGALLFVPVSRSFAWQFVRGDSDARGLWVHDRIVASPVPVDVAFVGTSRTLLGVSDAGVEADLAARGRTVHVANLGYPRNGRNQHYVIARDLLEAREVAHLVVEVGNDEHRGSHPMFGYVARTQDLLGAPLVPDTYYVEDLYHGLAVRLNAARHDLLGLPTRVPDAGVAPHAYATWVHDGLEDPATLAAAQARRRARAAGRGAPAGARTERPRRYLEALGALAASHGTRLHFLYLPTYGWAWDELAWREVYEAWGDVWIPPESIFRDASSWIDPYHLNREGNARLSAWLAERIAALD